jgi:exonuclease-1
VRLVNVIGKLIHRRFVDFAMHRVRMLQHFGVVPFLIFDGDYLPSKAATEADRQKRREESKRAGLELLNAGKTSQAYLEFQKAVDVTPEMARQLIDDLKMSNVQFIVAPYEADAQMVYLERKGILDGILSEDSDLLVFGAKCLLTKLDQYGNCIEINKADFCACKEINLTGWTETEFRHMAILSGCDYLASINNMGLKTAYRMIRKHKTIEKVLRMLSFDGKFRVPKGYLEDFYRAELTFLHQRVFCPKTETLVFHTDPVNSIDEERMPFIGAYVDPNIAKGVAMGDLNPITKLPIVTDRRGKLAFQTASRAASKSQPKQPISSSDGKKEKSIGTFFKPKRVPLAELDINCFKPSPTQQDALRRNSGPWAATPAPRPYLSRHSIEPQQISPSAPVQNTGRTHVRTPTVSEPRPPKRARLCEESGIDLLGTSQAFELSRSRFFASAKPEPSPSVGNNLRSRRSRKEDITIFSDDPIEQELLSLPDFDGFPGQTLQLGTKISGFKEGVRNARVPVQSHSSSGPPTGADWLSTSQETAPNLTPSMSDASAAEKPPTPNENIGMRHSCASKLQERFFYATAGTSTPTPNIRACDKPSPSSSISPKRSRIPIAVKSNAPVPKTSTLCSKIGLTPLQRLGASATNRSKFPMTPPMTPTMFTNSKFRRSVPSRKILPFPEVARDLIKDVVVPAMIPLPASDEEEHVTLAMQNGSEDMIIHDSESEGEGLSSAGEEAHQIDLGRFLYEAGVA